jgi:hypothetical protein
MDFVKLKKAFEDYAEVLHQYSLNTTTDRETLKEMFKTVLCKFVTKDNLFEVLTIMLVEKQKYHIENIKKDWPFVLDNTLHFKTFTNNREYVEEIVDTVKKFYKIK